MKLLDHLAAAVRGASAFNPDVQAPPVCILWPDRERQWETALPMLQEAMPELFALGEYAPARRTGPAIWLRCVLAGKIADAPIPAGTVPVFYTPGFGRQDLRVVEGNPNELKPLAELQFRGTVWSQSNGKDWTVSAFLKSEKGLALDVARDGDSKRAMLLSLHRLLNEELKMFEGKRLDRNFFNTLLTGDPVRDLLFWLDRGEDFRKSRGANEWRAFVEVCGAQFGFNPQKEGELSGAERLASRRGSWANVWERFCEAPKRYPGIPALLRTCSPPKENIFWKLNDGTFDGWPQWNEDMERVLREELLSLADLPPHEAREKVAALEMKHARRRSVVWTELGEAPLASALEFIAILAEITSKHLAAGTLEDLESAYRSRGWKADDAMLRALAFGDTLADSAVIESAVRSLYLPWAEESARSLQAMAESRGYPGDKALSAHSASSEEGECMLFVDGLRLDTAKRLAGMLQDVGFEVGESPAWAALPSVTATGKAAVSPVRGKIAGGDLASDFEPSVAETGQSLKGGYALRKLLADEGWRVLDRSNPGDGAGKGWLEFGDIDREGHERGSKLAKALDGLLSEVREMVSLLFSAGWKRVRIVTDHGWLLIPGCLPKTELSAALTVSKWGRCASLKPGASSDERLFPWYWNPSMMIALADGVRCFKNGEEYAHGGLSLQECCTLSLSVSSGMARRTDLGVLSPDIVWKGLRCNVVLDTFVAGVLLDVRLMAGDPSTSVVLAVRKVKENGTASVVVEDESLEGREAFVVLFNDSGALVAQFSTVIGGGDLND
jgi:hypothetical protein